MTQEMFIGLKRGACERQLADAEERLAAIDAIMEQARKCLKNHLRCGMSTDLREHVSLDDIKAIAKLAKVKGAKK